MRLESLEVLNEVEGGEEPCPLVRFLHQGRPEPSPGPRRNAVADRVCPTSPRPGERGDQHGWPGTVLLVEQNRSANPADLVEAFKDLVRARADRERSHSTLDSRLKMHEPERAQQSYRHAVDGTAHRRCVSARPIELPIRLGWATSRLRWPRRRYSARRARAPTRRPGDARFRRRALASARRRPSLHDVVVRRQELPIELPVSATKSGGLDATRCARHCS